VNPASNFGIFIEDAKGTERVIDLYTWMTPNGQKVSIMLEETGLPYRVHRIDIESGAQFDPEFLKISPNNKIPAIVDHDTGLRLMWQMGGAGPFLGQVHHFVSYHPGKSAYAEERYTKEALRLWKVLETRLGNVEYVAGDYSIADVAIWPWIARYPIQPVDVASYPNIKRWYHAIAARPAVQRGWDVVDAGRELPLP
jgi:GST-like protein